MLKSFDQQIFYAINRWPDSFEILFNPLSLGHKNPVVLGIIILIFIGYLTKKDRWYPMFLVMLSWPIANEVTDQLKAIFKGLRPSVELPDAIIRLDKLTSFGTASAHSANMMAIAVAMWILFGKKHGIFWVIIAILTGISRIYVGLHYPYQVLLGWFTGALVAFLIVKLGLYAKSRREKQKALESS